VGKTSQKKATSKGILKKPKSVIDIAKQLNPGVYLTLQRLGIFIAKECPRNRIFVNRT